MIPNQTPAVPLLAALLGTAAVAQSYTVTDLSVPGGRPQAIGADGTIVGFRSPGNVVRAFVHDPVTSTYSDLPNLPGANHAAARDVNLVGQVVGSSWTTPIAQPGRAFLFTPGTGMADLGVLTGPTSEACCVDNLANVGGRADSTAFTPEAMLVLAGGSMQSVVPGTSGHVLDIDASGIAVGVLGNNLPLYLLPGSTAPTFISLPPASPIGRATAVTANGWIAGEMSDASGSPSYAFRYHVASGTLDNLGSISRFGNVTGVDSAGNVVAIRQINSQSTPTALISLAGAQVVPLDTLLATPGWSIRTVSGINESGQMCGRAALAGGGLVPVRLDPIVTGTTASATVVGSGCSPAVVRASPPRLDRRWSMAMRGAAPGQSLFALLTTGHHPSLPLPGSSCDAYLSPAVPIVATLAAANAIGSWADSLALPANPTLAGEPLTLQLLLVAAGPPLGLVATEAVQVTVGS